MIAEYTRMLRRSDEISHRAMILGIVLYRPDADKTAHYAGSAPFDWTMVGDGAMAISRQCADVLGLREPSARPAFDAETALAVNLQHNGEAR